MAKSYIDLFVEETATLSECDSHFATIKLDTVNIFFKGASRKEAQAIADAINAAIEGAKTRALAPSFEPPAIAAE